MNIRRFRIKTILLLTALVAIPVAVLANAKTAFDRDQRTVHEISSQLSSPFGVPLDAHDSFGVTALQTSSVKWSPTMLGKLLGLSFFQRVSVVQLHSNECAGKIPDATYKLDLATLILRGDFDETGVASFRKSKPEVNVVLIAELH